MAEYKSYEDTAFVTGDSPATHNIYTGLGRAARAGYIKNTGAGILTFEISVDGTSYGDAIRLGAGDTHTFERLTNPNGNNQLLIRSIRVNWVSDTTYRIYAE